MHKGLVTQMLSEAFAVEMKCQEQPQMSSNQTFATQITEHPFDAILRGPHTYIIDPQEKTSVIQCRVKQDL